MIGEEFAPLTIINNYDADLTSMVTTFNIAATETASEILGKHRQKKESWINAVILNLCDKKERTEKEKIQT